MAYFARPFVIQANLGKAPREETRHNAASAMCLADDWAEDGYSNIRITDQDGVARSPESFRARLPLRKLAIQRQREMRAPQ